MRGAKYLIERVRRIHQVTCRSFDDLYSGCLIATTLLTKQRSQTALGIMSTTNWS